MPFAAILPAAIGAGVSLLGRHSSGGSSQPQSQTNSQMQPLIDLQTANARTAGDMSRASFGRADAALAGPLDFWTKAASGDTNALQRLLGPELDQVAEADAGRARSVSEFGARGGRRSEMMGAMGDDESNAINRLMLGMRPQAMGELGNIAQLLSGTGVSQMNASTGASGNALQSLLQNRSLDLQQSGQHQQALAGLGQGIGSILGILLQPGGVLNRGN
jgi:hypothetical protein